ncbi:hypothetical protein CERSUDRAFT_110893, partial [Gelatoporia subvermispora B]
MAIMEPNNEQEILRIWSLLTEVSEQLTHDRNMANSLHSLTDGIKTQAIHSQTGFVLRRFNLDKPREQYEAELERMTTAMIADNQALQNDNRQLNALIREYEQALEKVMNSFRTRAYEIQEHELSLMRAYESAIVQRETEMLSVALDESNARDARLGRLGRLLRAVLRKTNGEDVRACEALTSASSSRILSHERASSSSSSSSNSLSESAPSEGTQSSESQDMSAELDAEIADEDDPERRLAAAEWSLERECELARLQRENEELRRLLHGVLASDQANANAPANADPMAAPTLPKVPLPQSSPPPAPAPAQPAREESPPPELATSPATEGNRDSGEDDGPDDEGASEEQIEPVTDVALAEGPVNIAETPSREDAPSEASGP